jgi:glutaminyl-tRNA synthetase
VQAKLVPDTKSGTPGADAIKIKGNITWVAVADAVPVEVRLYERLFAASQPGSGELLEELNSASLLTTQAYAEPSLAEAMQDAPYQFERHGYFVLDARGNASGGRVFNRTAGMRDSWGK